MFVGTNPTVEPVTSVSPLFEAHSQDGIHPVSRLGSPQIEFRYSGRCIFWALGFQVLGMRRNCSSWRCGVPLGPCRSHPGGAAPSSRPHGRIRPGGSRCRPPELAGTHTARMARDRRKAPARCTENRTRATVRERVLSQRRQPRAHPARCRELRRRPIPGRRLRARFD